MFNALKNCYTLDVFQFPLMWPDWISDSRYFEPICRVDDNVETPSDISQRLQLLCRKGSRFVIRNGCAVPTDPSLLFQLLAMLHRFWMDFLAIYINWKSYYGFIPLPISILFAGMANHFSILLPLSRFRSSLLSSVCIQPLDWDDKIQGVWMNVARICLSCIVRCHTKLCCSSIFVVNF